MTVAITLALSVAATRVLAALGGWDPDLGSEGSALALLLIALLSLATVGCALWLACLRILSWAVQWPGKWSMAVLSVVLLTPVGASGFVRASGDLGVAFGGESDVPASVVAAIGVGVVMLGGISGGVVKLPRAATVALILGVPLVVWLVLLSWLLKL